VYRIGREHHNALATYAVSHLMSISATSFSPYYAPIVARASASLTRARRARASRPIALGRLPVRLAWPQSSIAGDHGGRSQAAPATRHISAIIVITPLRGPSTIRRRNDIFNETTSVAGHFQRDAGVVSCVQLPPPQVSAPNACEGLRAIPTTSGGRRDIARFARTLRLGTQGKRFLHGTPTLTTMNVRDSCDLLVRDRLLVGAYSNLFNAKDISARPVHGRRRARFSPQSLKEARHQDAPIASHAHVTTPRGQTPPTGAERRERRDDHPSKYRAWNLHRLFGARRSCYSTLSGTVNIMTLPRRQPVARASASYAHRDRGCRGAYADAPSATTYLRRLVGISGETGSSAW